MPRATAQRLDRYSYLVFGGTPSPTKVPALTLEPAWHDSDVSHVESELHGEFEALCAKAGEYRRLSYGRDPNLPRAEEHRHAFPLLSHQLWLIGDLVNRHPELRDEYRNWVLRIYPTFTSED
jgi:hypothetical protein